MMTPLQHVKEAEKLLTTIKERYLQDETVSEDLVFTVAIAQVHATLAVARITT